MDRTARKRNSSNFKKITKFSEKKKTKKNSIKISNVFTILLFFFTIGVILGVIIFIKSKIDVMENFTFLFEGFVVNRIDGEFFTNFLSSLAPSFLLVFFIYTLGYSGISAPITVLAVMYKGLSLGVTAAYLYSTQGTQGVLFFMLIVAPSATIAAVTTIYAARESIKFSMVFFKFLYSKSSFGEAGASRAVKLYTSRFTIALLVLIIAAAIDVALSSLFLYLF